MNCPSFRTLLQAALCCCLLGTTAAQAAPKSETLLPDTTKGYVSIANIDVLRQSFNQTQWGQLIHDPAMQPFVEDFRHQLQEKGVRQLDAIGLSWDELNGVPGGEISVAMVRPAAGRMAIVTLVDVTGHQTEAAALMDKINARVISRGAQRLPHEAADKIFAYSLPDQEGQRTGRQLAYFLQDNILAASDDIEVLNEIFTHRKGDRTDSLANTKAFHSIVARCDKSAGGVEPQIRWFIDPFGYAQMIRDAAIKPRRKGIDLLTGLKNQGFTAVQAVGGYLNFSLDKFEIVHRTMIYAPPAPGHEKLAERYELAAQMLSFPVSGDLNPQSWVPAHVATYNTFNWDIKKAFSVMGPLVDDVMAEKGVFNDVLDSLKNDPQGPKVDIAKDLVGNLGSRVTVITDYQLPIGPKSERLLIGIETTNEAAVTETIARTMKADSKRREFEGHVIWEMVDEECDVPDLKIENPAGGDIAHADAQDDKSESKKHESRLMQNAAVTVAYGHLFVSSNLGFLQTVLHQAGKSDGLASAPDYRYVADRMKDLGAKEISFRMFSRTDEEYRPTYELIRTNQMPQSETVLGQILNGLLGEGKEGVPRKQKIDGGKLPEFDTVSHYFGPAGSFCASEPKGWFLVGFTLDKARVTGEVARKPSETKEAATPANDMRAKGLIPVKAPVTTPAQSSATAITGQKPKVSIEK